MKLCKSFKPRLSHCPFFLYFSWAPGECRGCDLESCFALTAVTKASRHWMHKLLLNWDSSAKASWMSQVGHCNFPDHFDLNLPVPQFPVWSWYDEVKCRRYSMVPTKHQQISDEHHTHKKLIMPSLSRGWLGSQEGGTGPCWMRSVKERGLAIILRCRIHREP